MKLILEHQDQLGEVATISRNNVYLIKPGVELEVKGIVEITNPLKFAGKSRIVGEDGSCLNFVNKGSLSCSKRAEHLTLKGITIRSELQRPVFHIDYDTADTLILQDVTIDAFGLGKCAAKKVAIVNSRFLNGYQSPLTLGTDVDSLVVSGVRHDSDQCLLDLTNTDCLNFGFISENYIKDNNSGLFLLGEDTSCIANNSLYMSNMIGLSNPLDIFRQKTKTGILAPADYTVTSRYAI